MTNEKIGWWEDIRLRIADLQRNFNNLDERETLLQRQVERLTERIEWLIKIRQEEKESKQQQTTNLKWKIALILQFGIALLTLYFQLVGKI